MINLVFSSDAKGFSKSATVIASILRRSLEPVHVRYWCSGFLPKDIEVDGLKVEFFEVIDDDGNRYPGHVSPAVFNRLRVINDCPDWDRCLVMDYDQLVMCDLGPLLEMELGDHLLAAKMQGQGVDMAYAMREWIGQPLPDGWEHVAGYAYFSMGPLLNLKEMRVAGTWKKLLAAHEAFGKDEQLSLTAATEGRSTAYADRWNLFPGRDLSGDEVPDGVIHWTGWPKPWHPGTGVWREDLWQSERTTWEQLRLGDWKKPLAVLIGCSDTEVLKGLMGRGWSLMIFKNPSEELTPNNQEQEQEQKQKQEQEQDRHKEAELKTPSSPPRPDLNYLPLTKLNKPTLQKAALVRVEGLDSLPPHTIKLLGACRYLTIVGPAMESSPPFDTPITGSQTMNRYTNTPGGTRPSLIEYGNPESNALQMMEDRYLSFI